MKHCETDAIVNKTILNFQPEFFYTLLLLHEIPVSLHFNKYSYFVIQLSK